MDASYGILGGERTAVVEMAAASGIQLIDQKDSNPLITTTFETGQLIAAAARRDIDKIIVTVGGLATNDAGVVMAQALSVKMFTASGDLLPDGLGGGELAELDDIKMLVACDVVNPLTGKLGASAVYGRQKDASSADFATLETNLRSVAALIRRDLEVSVAKLERGGAGGGFAAGLVAFASAKLVPGIELVLDFSRFL